MAKPAAVICLSEEEERTLKQYLRSGSTEQRIAERARMILLSGASSPNWINRPRQDTPVGPARCWPKRWGM